MMGKYFTTEKYKKQRFIFSKLIISEVKSHKKAFVIPK